MLVPYLNNPSEETIFGGDKIKEQHETMKLLYAQINTLDQSVHKVKIVSV